MIWVVLLLLPAASLGMDEPLLDPPTARVPHGIMVGTRFTTRGGRNVEGYLGIRYAAPPLGPLRFRPPQPLPRWEGVFNATLEGSECLQYMTPEGSEDCLFLNVYTPHASPRRMLAVMIFAHSGGYQIGSASSDTYGPHYFLDEDIVLVTFNYRLGVLGFLSLEDPVLSGNMGLKDHRAALRWVQQNILYFGGDPRKVTFFGQSAGGVSVHYLMKFSSHEDLFRAAILQSGSSLDPWAFQPPGSQEIYVSYIAAKTGCDEKNPAAILQCLREVPAEYFGEIIAEMVMESDPLEMKITLLTPMVEPPGSEDPLVTADPWTVPTSTPFMAGVTDRESLAISIPPYLDEDLTNLRFTRFDMNYTHYLPINLQINTTAEDPRLVSKLLKEFYLGDKRFSRANYLDMVDLYSDGIMINGVFRAARSNRQKTYFYYFTYKGMYTTTMDIGSPLRLGVAHRDDLFFFFYYTMPPDSNPLDIALSKQLVKMWTNYAKYLDPTPGDAGVQWEPVTTPNIEYLHIGQTGLTMEKDFLKSRMDFWDDLPFRNKPFEFNWPYTPSRALSVGEVSEKYLGNRQGQQESELGTSFYCP